MIIQLETQYVKGHQDDEVAFEDLDRISQLNVYMDIDAKYRLKRMLEQNITTEGYAFHTLAIPKITIAGIEVYDQLPKKAYDMITGEKALTHWIRRGRFKKEAVKEISWSSQMKAMRQEKIGTRRFITKWANDYVAVGKNMIRWRLRETAIALSV